MIIIKLFHTACNPKTEQEYIDSKDFLSLDKWIYCLQNFVLKENESEASVPALFLSASSVLRALLLWCDQLCMGSERSRCTILREILSPQPVLWNSSLLSQGLPVGIEMSDSRDLRIQALVTWKCGEVNVPQGESLNLRKWELADQSFSVYFPKWIALRCSHSSRL